MSQPSPHLLLGPALRHVGETDATIWVETDRPCTVEVLGVAEPTWCMAGHHYALIVLTGLPAGASIDYDVRLDGVSVWPEPDDRRPQPRIRTLVPEAPVRIAFGSCRYARSSAVPDDPRFEPDALMVLAQELSGQPESNWPHALLMLGDQVYADETTERTQARIRQKRDITRGAGTQVADFEEYTWLYDESWTDPDVRWLMSVLPSSMIFDDHDVRDDWNTSRSWRREMQATDWWEERIIGGLSSYWVYQHLGNLAPADLATDELFQQVRAAGTDVEPMLREFARGADAEADGAKGARWSYRRDIGPVRLVMIDSRCGRMLDTGQRSMISDREFSWICDQVDGDFDHLLIGTSLPWLLPRALHDVEAWNEVLADGGRGKLIAKWSEKFRRAADMEHWAAFGRSFRELAGLIRAVASGRHGQAPATVCVLSGDVHHAYVSKAFLDEGLSSQVFQLTCSPFHNYVPAAMKRAFRLAWSRAAERSTRVVLGAVHPVPDPGLAWRRTAGPYFGNELMTFVAAGRLATVELAKTSADRDGLHVVDRVALSTG